MFAAAEFPEVTIELQPEDTLLLYTDGLIERNPRVAGDVGPAHLLASLTFRDVDDLIAQIEDARARHTAGAPARRHRRPGHPGHRSRRPAAPAASGTGAPMLVHALAE